jgi:hypothetical protein
MSHKQESPVRNLGLHIHVYVCFALIVLSLLPFFIIFVWGGLDSESRLPASLAGVVAFQVVLWFARLRCTAQDLSYWDSLVIVAAYMSIGVGALSLAIAGACVIASVIASIVFTVAGVIKPDPIFAARKFRNVVLFFGRHRMYQ